MLRNRHPGAFVYPSLFLILFFWFFGIDLSALRSSYAESAGPSTSPEAATITLETQNLSFTPNFGVELVLPRTITAILPVLPETVDQIPDLLKPFLNPPDIGQLPGKYNQSKISHLIVLSPESSLAFVRRELQAAFIFLRPALDLDLDISLHPWSLQVPIDESDEISLEVDVALLRAVTHLGVEERRHDPLDGPNWPLIPPFFLSLFFPLSHPQLSSGLEHTNSAPFWPVRRES
jgi:hypothetical protein